MDNLNNLYVPVRERIFTLAKSKAISQRDFAHAIKISPQTITAWKAGRNFSYMKKLSPIAEVLGTSEVWLLTGKETISDDDTIQKLDSIADSLGIHVFDLLGFGSKLDLYKNSFEDLRRKDGGEIPPEDKRLLKEMLTAGPRQLYDKLVPDDKREFWRLFQDYFQDASIGRSWSKAKPTPEDWKEEYPAYSPEACKLAEDFDKKLDAWGRKAVRAIMDSEVARCRDEACFLEETAEPEEPKVIPLYRNPAAAGYASPVFGEDYDPYALKPDDPQGAVFAVRLQGDSMEPDFPDGSVVFCNLDPLADGDIGIFNVNGASVCKQYHKEGPMTFLFSLNRKRADADVMLRPEGNQTLVCQGRVITQKRYRVPGR